MSVFLGVKTQPRERHFWKRWRVFTGPIMKVVPSQTPASGVVNMGPASSIGSAVPPFHQPDCSCTAQNETGKRLSSLQALLMPKSRQPRTPVGQPESPAGSWASNPCARKTFGWVLLGSVASFSACVQRNAPLPQLPSVDWRVWMPGHDDGRLRLQKQIERLSLTEGKVGGGGARLRGPRRAPRLDHQVEIARVAAVLCKRSSTLV